MKRGGLIVVHMTKSEWRWLHNRLYSAIEKLDAERIAGSITRAKRRKLTMLREFHDTLVDAKVEDS